ncbi:MAG: TldD/PmbA family protein [Calditrichaeota bacterium]|nr:MAG: TldD/PmbA family protein [Calditrichota bacterium]
MTNKERLELAQWAMRYALKKGANQAAVSITNQRSVEVAFREKKVDKLAESTQNSLSLDIYAANRYSSHSTCDLRRDSLGPFIEEAVSATKYLAEDEFRLLPDPRYYPQNLKRDLMLADAEYQKVETRNRVELAAAIEAAARESSDKIISVTSNYSDSFLEFVQVHSNGFSGQIDETYFQLSAEATVKDENAGRPDDYAYAYSRFFHELPASQKIGKEVVYRACAKIGQKKIASGTFDVIVENRAAGNLLGMLQEPLSARSLQQKTSYLDGMLEKKIASELLSVKDDPFIEKGLGSRLFDGEGLAATPRVIIEKGILKSYFIDHYYGRKLNMEPNSGSTSNLIFSLGEHSLEEMIKALQRGIVITDFIGGNSNATTGDFSFGIIGQYVVDGEIVHPINEMNITGNGKELWNQLVELGNDPFVYSSNQRPSMRFAGVQLSGL